MSRSRRQQRYERRRGGSILALQHHFWFCRLLVRFALLTGLPLRPLSPSADAFSERLRYLPTLVRIQSQWLLSCRDMKQHHQHHHSCRTALHREDLENDSSRRGERPATSSVTFRDMRDLLERVATTPDETVLIVFTAANCGPCKLQKQELLEFRQRLLTSIHNDGDDSNSSESSKEAAASVSPPPLPRLKMLSIDTSKWPHVGLSWFQVSKLPCLVVLRDQQVVARLEGLTRADTLLDILRPHLFLSQQ